MGATTERQVVMPRLSDGMHDGTIVSWLIADGAPVTEGEDLVEIETDKATAVYQAPAGGTLKHLVAERETVPVGMPIADLGGDGVNKSEETATKPNAPSLPETSPRSSLAPALRSSPRANGRERRRASPLARRLAAEAGVDLSSVSGSGPRDRVTRRDVEAYVQHGVSVAPTEPVPGGAAGPERELVSLTRSQSVVARRMAEAKSTIPDFQTAVEIDMEGCVSLREALRALSEDEPVPSYNDMVIRACALALREHPRVNSSYRGDSIELHGAINVGMAVAADQRLLVATIRGADRSDLRRIASETRRLARRVREQTITPAEVSGATFTVSNLGMFGVDRFTAVINPGQAAILAVGAVAPRAVVRDGGLVARTMMQATLSADHRIVYGADAARFLASIRRLLEHPVALLAG